MGVPRKVREQAELADRLLQEQMATPAIEPAADPAPEPSPEPEAKPEVDVSEQRFRVLQGKYNSEVPRLHERIKELEASLQATLTKAPSEAPASSTDDDFSPEFREDYGEVIDIVSTVVDRTLNEKLKPLQEQVEKDRRMVEQEAADRYQADIRRLVTGDFEATNQNPAFIAWLSDTVEPFTGASMHTLLNAAHQTGDAARVATIFNTWLAQQGGNKADRRETMVSPEKAGSATARQGAEKPSFTRAQVKQFYADLSIGKYKGQEAKAAAIDKQIHAAMVEGRIM